MDKLLVNAPSGMQEILEVGEGGGYFDTVRVLWDERVDGPLPEITLGGMIRVGAALEFSQARMDETTAAGQPQPDSLPGDTTVSKLGLRLALFDAGLWAATGALIATWTERQQIDWAERVTQRRDGAAAEMLQSGLVKTSGEIDAVFIAAAALP